MFGIFLHDKEATLCQIYVSVFILSFLIMCSIIYVSYFFNGHRDNSVVTLFNKLLSNTCCVSGTLSVLTNFNLLNFMT